MSGIILHYNQDRAYGFILDDETKRQYFFHVSDCNFLPATAQRVNFEIGQGRKGVAAVNVTQAVTK